MSFNNPSVLTGEPPETADANLALAAQESGYIPPDVETDQDAIAQQIFANLAARVPGWTSHDGNLDTWLIEAFSEVGAEIRTLAADVPATIFAYYGTNVLGIPPEPAAAAVAYANFTASDNAGYTLDTGTTFALSRSGNDLVAFATLAPATISPGSTTITGVACAAVETGADANGLSGAGQMLDPITFISAISVPSATTGGTDAERPEDYVDRLSNLFAAVALRPVLPQDFAILALQLFPDDVGRAVTMNLYDPGSGTWTNARTVTLILTQADGTPCTSAVKAEVMAMLQGLREVNWIVNIIDPVYTAINVTFTATAYAGQNPPTVTAACVASLTAYLQPSNFRLGALSPAIAGGEVIYPPTGAGPTRRQVIRINDLISLLDQSLGVDYVSTVTINGSAADFTLPHSYSLPQPGTITGTVSAG